MSFVSVEPELVSAAASGLHSIDNSVNAGLAFAAAPTTGVLAPAADPVSALTAGLFAAYASAYQSVAAEAAAIQQQFVATIHASAESYSTAEALNNSLASLETEVTRIAQSFIAGTINAPPISYLSSLIPFLFGVNVVAMGAAAIPAAPAAAPAALPALASSATPLPATGLAAGLGSAGRPSALAGHTHSVAAAAPTGPGWATEAVPGTINGPAASSPYRRMIAAPESETDGSATVPAVPAAVPAGLRDDEDGPRADRSIRHNGH